MVSVPLPGFIWLRPSNLHPFLEHTISFSPVAGIHLIATATLGQAIQGNEQVSVPLPGFIWLRRSISYIRNLLSIKVSVPLPGFIWLRQYLSNDVPVYLSKFQSRCRDSFDCDVKKKKHYAAKNSFSPVAGIHLIATLIVRLILSLGNCFSPVAGIHLIATKHEPTVWAMSRRSFSPVAGIHLIAT